MEAVSYASIFVFKIFAVIYFLKSAIFFSKNIS